MKIGITGHTAGFGQYMFNKSSESNTVLGFSRTTGYDISLKTSRDCIINQVNDCDIFINCAQSKFHQTDLLYDLFYSWRKESKLIINIGSNARDFPNRETPYDYSVQKIALNAASKQLGRIDKCKITTVDFGFLTRTDGSAIGYDAAYEYIELAINSLNKNYRLLEILVAHT